MQQTLLAPGRHDTAAALGAPARGETACAARAWDRVAPSLHFGDRVTYAQLGTARNKLAFDTLDQLPASLVDQGMAPWPIAGGALMVKSLHSFLHLPEPDCLVELDCHRPGRHLLASGLETTQTHRLERTGLWEALYPEAGGFEATHSDAETIDLDAEYFVGEVAVPLLGTQLQIDVRLSAQDSALTLVGEAKRSPAGWPITSLNLRQVFPGAFWQQQAFPEREITPVVVIFDSPLLVAGQAADVWLGRAYECTPPTDNAADLRVVRSTRFAVRHHD